MAKSWKAKKKSERGAPLPPPLHPQVKGQKLIVAKFEKLKSRISAHLICLLFGLNKRKLIELYLIELMKSFIWAR